MGGLVIEAHVHGLPTPNVKFYKDNHLLHARRNKVVFFVENKEIFQLLMVRPDASVSGTYTILAESAAGKRRFDHHVDFETKYPLIHLPGMYHADKKLDDFVDDMINKIPKKPEEKQEVATELEAQQPVTEPVAEEPEKAKDEPEKPKETPKPEEIVEALQSVVEEAAQQEKPKKKSKSKHRKKKRAESPKIDSDLINDGEDEGDEVEEPEEPYKRKFSTVVHESYETEEFRIFNNKQKLWFSGNLRDQTVIEGSTVKLICAVSGPLPIIKWSKNDKNVAWGQTIKNMSGEGIGQVIIEKITRADAGTYTCSAKNSVNEVTTSATIKVIPKSTVPKDDSSKPLFTRVLGQFYHITEDDLILDAHVRGVPNPEIKWYKDGIELNKAMDDRFDFSNDHDGGYQFRIHKPVVADSGLYACEASNSEGKAKISHKVEFNDRERHTHPQFVYHKESFYQPTLRMSIEPEPVKQQEPEIIPEIVQAAAQSGNDNVNIQQSQDSSSGSDGQSGSQGGDGNASSQNGSSGGDGNEDGDDKKEIPKSTSEIPEEEEEEEKKPKKPVIRSRRRRYEDPVEQIVIRDSVRASSGTIFSHKYF